MPFVLPTFNLVCNIWRQTPGSFPPVVAPDVVAPCNLALGRRVTRSPTSVFDREVWGISMTLLVPPGTDIRDGSVDLVLGGDWVEVPAGTGRFYFTNYVDDLGKGFPNEHRFAVLIKACDADGGGYAGYVWPAPIP
jgi:hypothetical protein